MTLHVHSSAISFSFKPFISQNQNRSRNHRISSLEVTEALRLAELVAAVIPEEAVVEQDPLVASLEQTELHQSHWETDLPGPCYNK